MIEILSYEKVELDDICFPGVMVWQVKIRVDGIFELIENVPETIAESDLQTYLDSHYDDIFEEIEHIFKDKIPHVAIHRDVEKIKLKLKE